MKRVDRQHQTYIGYPPAGAVQVRAEVVPGTDAVISSGVLEARVDAALPTRPFTIIRALMASAGRIWHEEAALSLEGQWVSLTTIKPLAAEHVVEYVVLSEALDQESWELTLQHWKLDDKTKTWSKREETR